MAMMSIENTPWYSVRFEEMIRILELNKVNGEKRQRDFQERKTAVKQRQEFLQHRRIARLKMEGIIIDIEAVKRRCKAPKESIWYEAVSDEEEKKTLMRKRLKEMFKTKNSQNCIQERSDSSCSDEYTSKKKEKAKEVEQPQRGQLLRNYTKMYGVVQEKTKETSNNKEIVTIKETDTDDKLEVTSKTSNPNEKGTLTNKAPVSVTNSGSTAIANKVVAHKTRNTVPSNVVDKRISIQKFQKAVTKVTNVNKLGDGPGRKSISPIVQKLNTHTRLLRHSSDSGSSSPALPRINSGISKK